MAAALAPLISLCRDPTSVRRGPFSRTGITVSSGHDITMCCAGQRRTVVVAKASAMTALKSCRCLGGCSHGVYGFSGSRFITSNGHFKTRQTPQAKKGNATIRADSNGPISSGPTPFSLLNIDSLDRDKAEGMQYRRVVYSAEDWKKHRSSGRHARHIATIPSSRIITALGPPVAFMTSIATVVTTVNTAIGQHILPAWVPVLHVNPLPLSLTASALGFLLVFRTNASYGRFDEARKMIGLMLNRVRDTTRLALSYVARDEYEYERPVLMQFVRHLQAFPLAYKHHFVTEGTLEADLRAETSLTEAEIQGVLSATHRPNYVLQMCSECLRTCHVEPALRLNMDVNLATFADDIGGSERIFKTPIPVSYTRLTSRFLVVWHIFLPFALWDSCNWITIPATAITAAVFFCIEEVGVLIEEPFSILALSAIAGTARNNVAELVKLHADMRRLVVPVLPHGDDGAGPSEVEKAEESLADAVAQVTCTNPAVVRTRIDQVGAAIRTEAPSWSRPAPFVNRNTE